MEPLSPTSATGPTATICTQTDTNDLLPRTRTSLLALPLEVIGIILDHSFTHPETQAIEANQHEDTRSHGWNSTNTSLKQMSEYQAAYSDQVLALMKTCRTFYHFLLPRFYQHPVLVRPSSIKKFYLSIKATPKLSKLVTKLVLYPSQQVPTQELIDVWHHSLSKYLKHLTGLRTLSLGIYTSLLSNLSHTATSIAPFNSIEALDQLDLYTSYTHFDPRAAQDGVLSLINRSAPHLKRLSFSTINLLEKGCGIRQSSRFLNSANARWGVNNQDGSDDEGEAEEYHPDDSCATRFIQAIRAARVGYEWEETREDGHVEKCRERGIQSLYFFGEAAIGVGVLYEMLSNMPNLHCLHLDAFTLLGPSLSESIPFYLPRKGRLSLPKLVESFASTTSHLTELTFAPVFAGIISTDGKMDSILKLLPHLTHLELRCDFVTPKFFSPLLSSSKLPLRYLAFHILPPHAPPSFYVSSTASTASGTLNTATQAQAAIAAVPANPANPASDDSPPTTTLRKAVAVIVFQFYGTEITELAQAVEDVCFEDEEGAGKVCSWPEQSQEEFSEETVGSDERQEKWNEPYWYDLLMRLGRLRRDTNEVEESEEGSEEGSDEVE